MKFIITESDEEYEENPMVYRLRWETGVMNGAPIKVNLNNIYKKHN